MKTFVIGDVHGRRAQLARLLDMLPRDASSDTLVFLGDLIDRGRDAPGVVQDVIELQNEAPGRVHCLRGNHEQMLLDFIDEGASIWLTPVTGGERTFEQYTGSPPAILKEDDFALARHQLSERRFPRRSLITSRSPASYSSQLTDSIPFIFVLSDLLECYSQRLNFSVQNRTCHIKSSYKE